MTLTRCRSTIGPVWSSDVALAKNPLQWAHCIRRMTRMLLAVLPAAMTVPVGAIDLPQPQSLEREVGVQRQTLTVLEPHESVGERRVMVAYSGFPMNVLLTHWFGDLWRSPTAEVAFEATDGYRSVIAGSRLQRYQAILAVSRADGHDFVVDNPAQHQSRVPLGPYYLVWDNLTNSELQAQGTLGWPYQVARVELRSSSEEVRLIPVDASEVVKAGATATKDHCLNCHQIRGVGGGKFPEPLERAVCNWSDAQLTEFIDDPGRIRPGSTMPALGGIGDTAARRQTITRIISYLNAIKAVDSSCSGHPAAH